MGIFYKKTLTSGAKIGIWEITESLEELKADLIHFHNAPTTDNHRTKQSYAARLLLHALCPGENLCLIKDEFGKPRVENDTYYISISHSGKYAAAILSRSEHTGIDIEKVNERIKRVGHKFASKAEKELLKDCQEADALHIIWGVKESLYKLYGRRQLDFLGNLKIEGHVNSKVKASISKGNYRAMVEMQYERFGEMLLVHTV